jgi:hypothetical protein
MNKKENSVGVSEAKRLSDAKAETAIERQVRIPPPALLTSLGKNNA